MSEMITNHKGIIPFKELDDSLDVQEEREIPAFSYKGKWRAILLFGPPGVGKGTLGEKLAVSTEQIHVSTGDIFRQIPGGSPLGEKCAYYNEQGLLIPDECCVEIWYHYVNGLIATNRFDPVRQCLFLDGIPRTRTQVEWLSSYVNVVRVFSLEVENEQILFERLKGRAAIEGRKDDLDDDVLRSRIQIYHQTTEQVLSCYTSSLITAVDASQNKLAVFRDVLNHLVDLIE